MSGTSRCAFDNAPEHAGGRFDALETCYDPVTFNVRVVRHGIGSEELPEGMR